MGVKETVTIVGAGLSGLTLAYILSERHISVKILEASNRLGGRIQTVKGVNETPLELGATWFSEMHPNLLALIKKLDLKIYPQFSHGVSLFQTKSFEPPQKFFVPEAELPSYRLVGGTQMLIDTLGKKIPDNTIMLNAKVTAIKETKKGIVLETSDGQTCESDKVIVCIPPQLAGNQITFLPELPVSLSKVLSNVQTWMAGAVKFVLEYEQPFWRSEGFSGMLYSHAGIITEMYDHTNFEKNKFGFTGFLNNGSTSFSQQVRKDLVIRQLSELFGEMALDYTTYIDKIWTDEYIMAGHQVVQRPHQNNGHPLLQKSYMGGKLFFAATETATQCPGYMEGAVCAATKTAQTACNLPQFL